MAKKKTTPKKKIVNPFVSKNRTLHKVNLLVQLVSIAAVLGLMKAAIYPLSLSFVTKDALLSQTGTVFVPAERVMIDFDIRWLLLGLSLAAALYSLLLLTRWRIAYENAQNGRIYLWRWAALAIGGAIMIKTASIVNGVEDIVAIKLAGGLMILAMAFAWISERQNEKVRVPIRSAFILSLITGLIAFYPIVASLIGTTVYGIVRLPWYAYVLDALALIGFLLVIFNLRASNRQGGQAKNYGLIERNYIAIALVTQLAFVITAIWAFHA